MLDKLPEVYIIKLPENNKQEFLRLAKIACTDAQTWVGSEKLYKFDTKTKQGSVTHSYIAPEVSFEDWKRLLESKKVLDHYQVAWDNSQGEEFLRLLTIACPGHNMIGGTKYYEICNSRTIANGGLIKNIPLLTIQEWREMLEGAAPTPSSGKKLEYLTAQTAKVGMHVIPSNKWDKDKSKAMIRPFGTILRCDSDTCKVEGIGATEHYYYERFYIYEGQETLLSGKKLVTCDNAFIGMKVVPTEAWKANTNKPLLLPFATVKEVSNQSAAIMVLYSDGRKVYHYMKDFYVYEESNNFSQIKQQQNEQHNNGYKANLFINYQSYGRTEKPRGSVLRLRTSPTFFSSKHLRNQACSL